LHLEIRSLAVTDVKLISVPIHRDARGLFSETYSRERMVSAGIVAEFVQDNHALSLEAGTLRGLHF